jgi:hypothetical protein
MILHLPAYRLKEPIGNGRQDEQKLDVYEITGREEGQPEKLC